MVSILILAESFDRDSADRVLADLADFTSLHFMFEQCVLEQAGYVLARSHKYEHAKFIEHLMDFVERHNKGEDVIDNLYIMLSTWLIKHIKRDHMAYVSEHKTNMTGNITEKVHIEKSAWMDRYFNRLLAK